MEELKREFELFGLEEKFDLKSLKRAYYDLALIVHPDRNTCIDKKEANDEMEYLTKSYKKLKVFFEKRDFENEITNSNDLKVDNAGHPLCEYRQTQHSSTFDLKILVCGEQGADSTM